MSCLNETQEVLVGTYRGDSVRINVRLDDDAGAPIDATSWLWLAQIRSAAGGLVSEFTVDTEHASEGTVSLALSAAQTDALVPADYVWDLQATDDALDVRTLVTGRLRIRADVSRSTP